MRTPARDQRGSGTLLLAGLMGVVVLLSAVAILVAGYAVGYHRARTAADLAAISAAAAYADGRDACRQARRTAGGNGAEVTDCDQVGDQLDFVVTVRVAVPVRTRLRGLPRRLEAVAHAGSVPR